MYGFNSLFTNRSSNMFIINIVDIYSKVETQTVRFNNVSIKFLCVSKLIPTYVSMSRLTNAGTQLLQLVTFIQSNFGKSLSIFLSIYQSYYLFIYLTIYLSIDLDIYLYIHLTIYKSVLNIFLSFYLAIYLSIYLFFNLYIFTSISI